ncbi:S41 family peptidase [Reichenbachiella sp.]
MVRLFVIFIGVVLSIQVSAQKSSSYQEDFQIYKKALLETHPSLYRFTPQKQFDAVLDSVESTIDSETTEWEFFRALHLVHAMIRESHSFLGVPNQLMSKATSAKLFPLQVWITESKMLITGSREESYAHLVGQEIVSINGQSVKSLVQTLETFSLLNTGYNNSAIYKELSGFNNFAFSYYFFVSKAESFELVYVSDEKLQSETLAGSKKGLKGEYPQFPDEPKPPFSLKIDESKSTAQLTISTFAYWVVGKKQEDYQEFFENCFTELEEKNIKHLIIDVSNNRGGEEMIGAEFLTYFIDQPFRLYRQVSAKTLDYSCINRLPNSSRPKFSNNDFIDCDSIYVLKKGDILKTFEPKQEHRFTGNVYFIASGRSRSATNILLSLAKSHDLGIIIGQESGGASQDLDGRWRVKFNLPFSNVFVSYPVWRLEIDSENQNPRRGVIPDFVVDRGNEDVLSGREPELDFVYQLIQNEQ